MVTGHVTGRANQVATRIVGIDLSLTSTGVASLGAPLVVLIPADDLTLALASDTEGDPE